jgi:hypothetical protein
MKTTILVRPHLCLFVNIMFALLGTANIYASYSSLYAVHFLKVAKEKGARKLIRSE